MRPRRTAFEHSENGVLDPVPLYGQRTESPQIARKATERGEISRRRAFFRSLLVLLGHKNCRINKIEAIDLNAYSIE